MDTISLWINTKRESLLRTLEKVDIFFANDEEVRLLTQKRNLIKASKSLLEIGPSLVVAKKGEHGALLIGKDFVFCAVSYLCEEVVDPTGAGDTFAGGFLGYLDSVGKMTPAHFRQAAVYGTVMASFVIEDFGIERLKDLTSSEIDHRYQQLKEFVTF
jgi:sugar/nucleoside kinase (ribokinase family)